MDTGVEKTDKRVTAIIYIFNHGVKKNNFIPSFSFLENQ